MLKKDENYAILIKFYTILQDLMKLSCSLFVEKLVQRSIK